MHNFLTRFCFGAILGVAYIAVLGEGNSFMFGWLVLNTIGFLYGLYGGPK